MPHEGTVAEVRRRLAAPPARVFAAFADPALVSRWLTPSPEIALSVLQFEFRVGGAYRFAYHVPGAATMFVNGVYRTIDPPSTLVFSWNIEPPDEHAGVRSEVAVSLAPDGMGTHLLIRHTQLGLPGAADRHALGWEGAANRLVDVVATPPGPLTDAERGTT
jgi:uncharacterized protein YndB with AHSA1/START domain